MLNYSTAELLYLLNRPENETIFKKIKSVIKYANKHIYYPAEDGVLNELILTILAIAQKEFLMAAMVGLVASRIEANDPEIIAINVIILLADKGLLNIDIDNQIRVTGVYDFELQEQERHVVFTEADLAGSLELQDYQFGHCILGGYLKQQCYSKDDTIKIEHLDYMNGIPLSLNMELLRIHVMQPSEAQKDTEEFEEFRKKLYAYYKEVAYTHGNRFHIIHKYDNRGRCYANSYYANYQGNDFQKASIQLANKEVIQ